MLQLYRNVKTFHFSFLHKSVSTVKEISNFLIRGLDQTQNLCVQNPENLKYVVEIISYYVSCVLYFSPRFSFWNRLEKINSHFGDLDEIDLTILIENLENFTEKSAKDSEIFEICWQLLMDLYILQGGFFSFQKICKKLETWNKENFPRNFDLNFYIHLWHNTTIDPNGEGLRCWNSEEYVNQMTMIKEKEDEFSEEISSQEISNKNEKMEVEKKNSEPLGLFDLANKKHSKEFSEEISKGEKITETGSHWDPKILSVILQSASDCKNNCARIMLMEMFLEISVVLLDLRKNADPIKKNRKLPLPYRFIFPFIKFFFFTFPFQIRISEILEKFLFSG
jgi:hypothetical protein